MEEPRTDAKTSNTAMFVAGDRVVSARSVKKKRPTRDRCWERRQKVPSCLSKDFPWEVVLRFLQDSPRSLIHLQMVDRNLRHVLSTEHLFWAGVYKRHFCHKSYMVHRVHDPAFPTLRLFKEGLTGVPYHNGPIPGDPDPVSNTQAFKENFTLYVRRWYALLHGTRCGVCGCRFRHDVYWSLKMRVCKLCLAQNSISDSELFERYGVSFSEILPAISKRVFFFQLTASSAEDRMAVHSTLQYALKERRSHHMFWIPHLSLIFDLPKLRRSQEERRRAAALLCAFARKAWVMEKRVDFAGRSARKSIDLMLIEAYRNEKRRLLCTKPFARGGPEWAFQESAPLCRKSRHAARTGEMDSEFYRRLYALSDYCVPV